MNDPNLVIPHSVHEWQENPAPAAFRRLFRTPSGRLLWVRGSVVTQFGVHGSLALWYTDNPDDPSPTWVNAGWIGLYCLGDAWYDPATDILHVAASFGTDGAGPSMKVTYNRILTCSGTPNIRPEQTVFQGSLTTGCFIGLLALDTTGRLWVTFRHYGAGNYSIRTRYAAAGSDAPTWTVGPTLTSASPSTGHMPLAIEPIDNGKLAFVYHDPDELALAVRIRNDADDPATFSDPYISDLTLDDALYTFYSCAAATRDGQIGIAAIKSVADVSTDGQVDFQIFDGADFSPVEESILGEIWAPNLSYDSYRGIFTVGAINPTVDSLTGLPWYSERGPGGWSDPLLVAGAGFEESNQARAIRYVDDANCQQWMITLASPAELWHRAYICPTTAAATLAGTGDLSADALAAAYGEASLTGTGSMTASGRRRGEVGAQIGLTWPATATVTATKPATAQIGLEHVAAASISTDKPASAQIGLERIADDELDTSGGYTWLDE